MNQTKPQSTQSPETSNWPALLRGSVLSSAQSKHVQYISLADRRAQVIITINAFLIPLSLSGYTNQSIRLGILLFSVAAALSIFFAIMSLMPKRYKSDNSGSSNLLHFSGIWQYDEAHYKELMKASLESRNSITELMVSDIYHLSHDVLRPKFWWIRLSFYSFLIGLICALVFIAGPLIG
ncbi:MAG: Pycsar system effector family protein [Opitutaceae bacterium]